MFAQEQRLVLVLDTLGNHPQAHALRQGNDRPGDRGVVHRAGQAGDEAWSIFSLCTGSRLRRISEE